MSSVVIREAVQTNTESEKNTLDILKNLTIEKLNHLKAILHLGTPDVVGPETLAKGLALFSQNGFDLSDDGVNRFKGTHGLGNSGALHGVIGAQTAAIYYDELMQKVNARSGRSVDRILLSITSTFEGAGFTALAGDFDGQGISFGALQWNFGQGSLQPLLRRMRQVDPMRFQQIIGDGSTLVQQILSSSNAEAIRLSQAMQLGTTVKEPWKSRFRLLAQFPPFQDVQLEFTQKITDRARAQARKVGLLSVRGLSLLFDILVQNGGIVLSEILERRERKESVLGHELSSQMLMQLIVDWLLPQVRAQFRSDVESRKMCIIRGHGTVHGATLNLDEKFGLSDEPWSA